MKKITCKKCGALGIRINKFDSFACKNCLIWLENLCSDKECENCSSRPATPENVDWNDPNNTIQN